MKVKSMAIGVGVFLLTAAAAFAQSVAVGTWTNKAQAAGGGRDAVSLVINSDGTGMARSLRAEVAAWIERHRRTVVDERADFADAYLAALPA